MFLDMAHTFSIVARDPLTGDMGVAVQSHWFNVGRLVPWARAGVGVVATQAVVEVGYGPLGLDLMAQGLSAPEALARLLAEDADRDVRQVAMVDAQGRLATHTGVRCIAEAGHMAGEQFSAQANMMLYDTVWAAMGRAYQQSAGELADRLLVTLEAAQDEGGDIRGQQSAAIVIVRGTASPHPWEDVVVDLRVEDHPTPVAELSRLLTLQRAYDLMNEGDEHLGKGEMADALREYAAAAELAPHIAEIPFWHAVALADRGHMEEALPIFQEVFSRNPNLALLAQRLPDAGLLRDDPEMMEQIVAASLKKP